MKRIGHTFFPIHAFITLALLLTAIHLTVAAEPTQQTNALPQGFVLIPGGSFQMGDLWGDSPWAMGEPVHDVQVDDFLLATHEVTVAQFTRFVEATGYKTLAEGKAKSRLPITRDGKPHYPFWRDHWFKQGSNHPVVAIAWEDAIVYCNWLSRQHRLPPAYDEKTGQLLSPAGQPTTQIRQVKGFRLPTEAEWEFAAREGGRKIRFGNGQNIARPGEMNFDAAGTGVTIPRLRMRADNLYPYNEKGTNWGGTSPVGSFRANALGLYDMSGNAWEWCSDTGGGSDKFTGKQVNPCTLGGTSHIVRGGTHDTDAKACRASARIDWYAQGWCGGSGFRVARTQD